MTDQLTMNNPHSQLRTYLMNLIERFLLIESLHAQRKLIHDWERPGRIEALNMGAFFFRLVSISFQRTVLIELCMLLSEREQRNLIDFLRKAKMYASSVHPTRHNIIEGRREEIKKEDYVQVVNQNLRSLAKHNELIDRIKARRDKALAHADSTYFNDPNALYRHYPLADRQISQLIRIIGGILHQHYSYLFGSDLQMRVVSATNVSSVLTLVRAFNRVWEDKRLVVEKGVKPYVYKLDEYQEGSSVE